MDDTTRSTHHTGPASDTAVFLTPIFDPYVGGAAVHFDQLTRGLVDAGAIDSFVVVSAYAEGAPVFESRPGGRVFRVLFSPNSIHRRWPKAKIAVNYLLAAVVTAVSVLVFRASTVQTHTKRYFTAAVRVAKLLGATVVVDGRDLGAPSFAATGDVFVAASENISNRTSERAERVVRIPIGIDPDELTVDCSEVELASDRYILFVGDIAERKGVRELLEAYGSEHRDRELVLIGEWVDRELSFRETDGVRYLGPRPHSEVLCYIRAADLVVLPSKEEALGRVILEAIFHGTPVVCPPVVPEFRAHLPRMTAASVTPDALAETMDRVLNTGTTPDSYPIEEHFVGNVIERYAEVYR